MPETIDILDFRIASNDGNLFEARWIRVIAVKRGSSSVNVEIEKFFSAILNVRMYLAKSLFFKRRSSSSMIGTTVGARLASRFRYLYQVRQ